MQSRTPGAVGEAAILSAFVRSGYQVLIPFGEGQPYDLVVATEPGFVRIQCKTAWLSAGCLLFNAYATDHGRGQQSYLGRADLFGIYLPKTEAVYLVPVGLVPSAARLRLEPTRNGQRARVRLAADFEFDRWAREDLRRLIESPSSLASTAAVG